MAALALAIGCLFASVNLADVVLFRRLPFQHAASLQSVQVVAQSGRTQLMPYPLVSALKDATSQRLGLAAYGMRLLRIGTGERGRTVSVLLGSGDLASTIGVGIDAGRWFDTNDDTSSAPLVAVVSHRFATREFGDIRRALGARLMLEGRDFAVIGVAPPEMFGFQVGRQVDVYAPLQSLNAIRPGTDLFRSAGGWLEVIARPRREGGAAAVTSAVQGEWAAALARSVPSGTGQAARTRYAAHRFRITPAEQGRSAIRDRSDLWLRILVIASVALLSLATLNALVFAKASLIREEMNLLVRRALGASRRAIFAQECRRALVGATVAAVSGVLIGSWLCVHITSLIRDGGTDVYLDLWPRGWVLGGTGAYVFLYSAVVGLLAVQQSGAPFQPRLYGVARMTSSSAARGLQRLSALYVLCLVPSVAISVVLIGRLDDVARVPLQFQPSGVTSIALSPLAGGYGSRDIRAYYVELLQRVETIPGVRSAGVMLSQPLSDNQWTDVVESPDGLARQTASLTCISPRTLETLGIPIVRGSDVRNIQTGSVRSAIVTEQLAEELFPGEDPIGRLVLVGAGATEPSAEIVGVVRAAALFDPRVIETRQVYLSCLSDQRFANSLTLLFRTQAPGADVQQKVVRTILAAGVEAPFTPPRDLSTSLAEALAPERLLALAGLVLATGAMSVVLIGVLAVSAYVAAAERRTAAIKMALGATAGVLLKSTARQYALVYLSGGAIGVAAAVAAGRMMAAQLAPFALISLSLALASGVIVSAGAVGVACLATMRITRQPLAAVMRED